MHAYCCDLFQTSKKAWIVTILCISTTSLKKKTLQMIEAPCFPIIFLSRVIPILNLYHSCVLLKFLPRMCLFCICRSWANHSLQVLMFWTKSLWNIVSDPRVVARVTQHTHWASQLVLGRVARYVFLRPSHAELFSDTKKWTNWLSSRFVVSGTYTSLIFVIQPEIC